MTTVSSPSRTLRVLVRRSRVLTAVAVVSLASAALSTPAATQPAVVAFAPETVEAEVRAARAHAWAGRYADALAAWDRLLARVPDHREARLGRATTLAWAGQHDAALTAVRALRAEAPGPDVDRLAARVLAWQGDHAAAETAFRQLVAADASDAEAWFGLAQVLHWTARPREAASAIARARALAPEDRDIGALARTLREAQRPLVSPRVLQSNDTDGNLIRLATLEIAPPTRAGWHWQASALAKEAQLGALRSQSLGARLGAGWSRLDDRLRVSAMAGLVQLHGDALAATTGAVSPRAPSPALRPLLVARAVVRPNAAVTLGLAASDTPFDESAVLIARGVHLQTVAADVGVTLPRSVTATLVAERAATGGGTVRNTRQSLDAQLAWQPTTSRAITLRAYTLGWDTLGRADGYFAPRAMRLLEVGGRQVLGASRGLGATVEGGLGPQQLRLTRQAASAITLAARGSIGVHYTTTRGHVLELVGGASSLASALASGDRPYRIQYLALRARAPL